MIQRNEAMLLDFSEFELGKTVSARARRQGPIDREHEGKCLGLGDLPAACPFCAVSVTKRHLVDKMYKGGTSQFRRRGGTCVLHSCSICGWWAIAAVDITTDIKRAHNDQAIEASAVALLKKFDWKSKHLPMNALRTHLASRPELLHKIHTTKMEQLVQSVFREHFDCEVIHCGRVSDGGIDLLLVNADAPVAVQVKRRESPDPAESVSEVREFLGAMLLKGFKNGIFVSTAKRFSDEASAAARCAVDIGLASRFELFDIEQFLDVFRLRQQHQEKPWAVSLRNHFEFVTRRLKPEFDYFHDLWKCRKVATTLGEVR